MDGSVGKQLAGPSLDENPFRLGDHRRCLPLENLF